MLLILPIVLAVLFLGGGLGYNDGAYRTPGLGLGAIVVIIFIVLLATGRL